MACLLTDTDPASDAPEPMLYVRRVERLMDLYNAEAPRAVVAIEAALIIKAVYGEGATAAFLNAIGEKETR